MRCLPVLAVLLFACSPKTIEVDPVDTGAGDIPLENPDGEGDTGAFEEEEDFSEWDGATMSILSPTSGDFVEWGSEIPFEAQIYYADGTEADFDEILWSTDVDASWAPVGASFTDAEVEVGTHAFTAQASLPNGDRLVYTIGGVLVQSAYAGTYSGDIVVEGAYDAYSLGCSGGVVLYIDAYGELVDGEGSCLISLQGFELDMTFLFELENYEGDLEGEAGLDLFGWYQVPVGMTGDVTEDGSMSGSFDYDADTIGVYGTLSANRISRTIE